MALVNLQNRKYTPTAGIPYTYTTATASEWSGIPNSTYFYDYNDGLVHYKDENGDVLDMFTTGGGGATGLTGGTAGQFLVKNSGTDFDYTWKHYNEVIQLQITSEGSSISDGFKGYRYIDRDMNIEAARIFSNGNATINFSVKAGGLTIGSMSLANQSSAIDTSLSGWTRGLTQGTYLEFYVGSPGGTASVSQTTIVFTLDATKII
jgi:hypothetical protein